MRVVVDGRSVSVPYGSSVLAATRAAGARLPTLCHDDRLTPAGVCRLCLVLADGDRVAACTTPAREGMAVSTTDAGVVGEVRYLLGLTVEQVPARAWALGSELAGLCRQLDVARMRSVPRAVAFPETTPTRT